MNSRRKNLKKLKYAKWNRGWFPGCSQWGIFWGGARHAQPPLYKSCLQVTAVRPTSPSPPDTQHLFLRSYSVSPLMLPLSIYRFFFQKPLFQTRFLFNSSDQIPLQLEPNQFGWTPLLGLGGADSLPRSERKPKCFPTFGLLFLSSSDFAPNFAMTLN